MKKYRVRITDKAEADVAGVLAWFHDQAAETAGGKWLTQLFRVIDTLESMPERCALAAEATDVGVEIHEILVGKRRGTHRVLFQIVGQTVNILRIWHSARDSISADDL